MNFCFNLTGNKRTLRISIRLMGKIPKDKITEKFDYSSLLPKNIEWSWSLEHINNLILHEDKDILVLYKPPTILSQSDLEKNDSIFEACCQYLKLSSSTAKLGLVHRIDRPCSGILIFGKSQIATASLNDQIKFRRIHKSYLCFVNGRVSGEGTLEDNLTKSSDKVQVIHETKENATGLVAAKLVYTVRKLCTMFFLRIANFICHFPPRLL